MPKAQKKAGLTTDFSKDLWSPAEASNLRQQFSEMTEAHHMTYQPGRCIIVHPYNIVLTSQMDLIRWKARVIETRIDDNNHFHVKVNWFYNPRKDFAEAQISPKYLAGYDCNRAGDYEVVETNHSDVVDVDSCSDTVTIKVLTDSPDQGVIEPGEFWMRSSFHYSKRGKGKFIELPRNCPICKKGYKPEAKSLGIQLYCPRKGCQHWIHMSCLRKKDRILRVAQGDPSSSILRAANIFSRNGYEGSEDGSVTSDSSFRVSSDFKYALQFAPAVQRREETSKGRDFELLLAFAGVQIVRGGDFGIAGNVQDVCIARQLVINILQGQERAPNSRQRKEMFNTTTLARIEELRDTEKRRGSVVNGEFSCPTCARAI